MIPRVSGTAQAVEKGFPGREILYMMFSVTFSFHVVCSNLPGINLPIYVNHIEASQRSYDFNDNLENNFSLYSFNKLIIFSRMYHVVRK